MKFNTLLQPLENNLLVVDALNLSFRFKGKVGFSADYIATVNSLKKTYNTKYVVICADKGLSSYRSQIHAGYKQNRRDKYANQTEGERLEHEDFMDSYEAMLKDIAEHYPVLRFKGVEADDIASYIVQSKDKYPIGKIWLISSDKDWDLLINKDVSRFSYVTKKEITYENWAEHYDFTPEEFISIKCLQGDTGDNVEGVEGVGPKRALELVKKYGSAMDIVESIPLEGNYKYIQSVNSSEELILRNYLLMDLIQFSATALGSNTKTVDEVLMEYLK